MFRTLVDSRSYVSNAQNSTAKMISSNLTSSVKSTSSLSSPMICTNTVRSTLRLLLVFGLFSVCAANSKYSRLNVLQRSLNPQPLIPASQTDPLLVLPLNNDEKPAQNFEYGKYTLTSNHYKRDGVRRCGLLLLKHIQKLCNGCVGRPRSSEESNRVKRSFDPFSSESESLTDLCCKKSCDDTQLLDFCCV